MDRRLKIGLLFLELFVDKKIKIKKMFCMLHTVQHYWILIV